MASSGWDTNQLALPKTELRGLIEADFMRIERTLPYVYLFCFVDVIFVLVDMHVRQANPTRCLNEKQRSLHIDRLSETRTPKLRYQ